MHFGKVRQIKPAHLAFGCTVNSCFLTCSTYLLKDYGTKCIRRRIFIISV